MQHCDCRSAQLILAWAAVGKGAYQQLAEHDGDQGDPEVANMDGSRGASKGRLLSTSAATGQKKTLRS